MSERMVTFSVKGAVSKGEAVVEVTVCSGNNEDFEFAVYAYDAMVAQLRQRNYAVTSDPERNQV